MRPLYGYTTEPASSRLRRSGHDCLSFVPTSPDILPFRWAKLQALSQNHACYPCRVLAVAETVPADLGAPGQGRDVDAAIHGGRGCRAIPYGLATGGDHSRDNIGRGRRNYSRRRTNNNHRFYSRCRQRIRKVLLTTLRRLLRVRVS